MRRFILSAAAALCCSGAGAMACSCDQGGSQAKYFRDSSAVFSGVVLDSRWEGKKRFVTMKVDESWKGVTGSTVTVWTGSFVNACGVMFETGKPYIVYASPSGSGLFTSICSGTHLRSAETAGEEMAEGRAAAGREKNREYHPGWFVSQKKELEGLAALRAAPEGGNVEKTIYDFKVKDAEGGDYDLKALAGKVALIVNVASKCGFTPQYEGLEALYKKYSPKGLVVLGFPCNQFGNQEPGTNAEIQHFCRLNYGVSFPVMGKIEVNGAGADPLYVYLKKSAPGVLGSEAIKWNFTKFLVDRTGKVVARYAPATKPEELAADIEKALGK